jgi:hypothetical protein
LADNPVVSKSKKQKTVFITKIVAEKLQKLNQEFSRENSPYLKIFLGNLLFGRDFWVAKIWSPKPPKKTRL